MSEDWQITKATVTDCDQPFLQSGWVQDGHTPEYRAHFEYTVNDRRYRGSMLVGTKWKTGRTFEISYDPKNPKRNTASRSFDPYDWHSYLYYGVIWVGGAIVLYLMIKYLPTKSEMMRP